MNFTPISLKEANDFVQLHHRHNKPVRGHKFSIGLQKDGLLIGVGIAGRPVARGLDDGKTLEILRVCVVEGHHGACSKLYARMKQIGQLFGYVKIKTYTLTEEAQSSLKAIAAIQEATLKPRKGWSCPSRRRKHQQVYSKEKIRWELNPHKPKVNDILPPSEDGSFQRR